MNLLFFSDRLTVVQILFFWLQVRRHALIPASWFRRTDDWLLISRSGNTAVCVCGPRAYVKRLYAEEAFTILKR